MGDRLHHLKADQFPSQQAAGPPGMAVGWLRAGEGNEVGFLPPIQGAFIHAVGALAR
jgi:hypothetical protein